MGRRLGTPISGNLVNCTGYPSSDITKTVKKQVFTADGTYTPSTGMIYCIIECVGSGGGGGGSSGGLAQIFGGGGGGSGSYSRLTASAATVGASKAVTVGSAGTGSSGTNNGGAGSDVSVGTICVAKGGAGGLYGAAAQVGGGGAGGVAGTGDLTATGASGGPGNYNTTASQPALPAGFGGSSHWGGGAPAPAFASGASTNGTNATNYGGGGSGAITSNVVSTGTGGNGSKGVVHITEFCNA